MKKIHPSKISYYARNKRLFLSNPRYKSMYRVKTKPTFTNAFFNTLIKEECSNFLKENGEHIKKENPDVSDAKAFPVIDLYKAGFSFLIWRTY